MGIKISIPELVKLATIFIDMKKGELKNNVQKSSIKPYVFISRISIEPISLHMLYFITSRNILKNFKNVIKKLC